MTDSERKPEFICTTVLEFEDRYEGQVLHRGRREDCEKVADLTAAISYSGHEEIKNSAMQIISVSDLDLPYGERWRCWK